MKNLLYAVFILSTSISFGQTKLIAYKSHSGSKANFSKALSKNLMSNSNFGMAPQRMVRNSKLDSVKLISEKVAIMFTSESCHYEDYVGGDKSRSSVWNAGQDTVYDHPLFNNQNSVAAIKKTIKDDYFFNNDVSTIVFVGFEGEYKKYPKQDKVNTKSANQKQHSQKEEEFDSKQNRRPSSIFLIFVISIFKAIFHRPF